MKKYYTTTWTKVGPQGDEYYTPSIDSTIQGRGDWAAVVTNRDTPPSYGILAVTDKLANSKIQDPTLHDDLRVLCPQQFPTFEEAQQFVLNVYGLDMYEKMVDQALPLSEE